MVSPRGFDFRLLRTRLGISVSSAISRDNNL